MDSLLKILYAPIQPFVWHPERAVIMGFVFIGLLIIAVIFNNGKIKMKLVWPLLLAFFSWLLFGVNEYIAYSNKSNIRIDLLFFGPLIMAISLFAMYTFIKEFFGRD